eukprot:954504_1
MADDSDDDSDDDQQFVSFLDRMKQERATHREDQPHRYHARRLTTEDPTVLDRMREEKEETSSVLESKHRRRLTTEDVETASQQDQYLPDHIDETMGFGQEQRAHDNDDADESDEDSEPERKQTNARTYGSDSSDSDEPRRPQRVNWKMRAKTKKK